MTAPALPAPVTIPLGPDTEIRLQLEPDPHVELVIDVRLFRRIATDQHVRTEAGMRVPLRAAGVLAEGLHRLGARGAQAIAYAPPRPR